MQCTCFWNSFAGKLVFVAICVCFVVFDIVDAMCLGLHDWACLSCFRCDVYGFFDWFRIQGSRRVRDIVTCVSTVNAHVLFRVVHTLSVRASLQVTET